MAIRKLVLSDAREERIKTLQEQIKTASEALKNSQPKSEAQFSLKQRIATLRGQLDRAKKTVSDEKEQEKKKKNPGLVEPHKENAGFTALTPNLLKRLVGNYHPTWLALAEVFLMEGIVQYRHTDNKNPFVYEVPLTNWGKFMLWLMSKGFKAGTRNTWYDPSGRYATVQVSDIAKGEGIMTLSFIDPRTGR
jgi:hypothetical protein